MCVWQCLRACVNNFGEAGFWPSFGISFTCIPFCRVVLVWQITFVSLPLLVAVSFYYIIIFSEIRVAYLKSSVKEYCYQFEHSHGQERKLGVDVQLSSWSAELMPLEHNGIECEMWRKGEVVKQM